MSLITYTDLVDLVERGVIEGVEPDRILESAPHA